MEVLTNIGIAKLCALGLAVFLVIMWFVMGMFFAMRDLLFKKRIGRNFVSHDDVIERNIAKRASVINEYFEGENAEK